MQELLARIASARNAEEGPYYHQVIVTHGIPRMVSSLRETEVRSEAESAMFLGLSSKGSAIVKATAQNYRARIEAQTGLLAPWGWKVCSTHAAAQTEERYRLLLGAAYAAARDRHEAAVLVDCRKEFNQKLVLIRSAETSIKVIAWPDSLPPYYLDELEDTMHKRIRVRPLPLWLIITSQPDLPPALAEFIETTWL